MQIHVTAYVPLVGEKSTASEVSKVAYDMLHIGTRLIGAKKFVWNSRLFEP